MQLSYAIDQSGPILGMVADNGNDNILMSRAMSGTVHVGAIVAMNASPSNPSPGTVSDIADNASAIAFPGVSVRKSFGAQFVLDGTGTGANNAVFPTSTVAGDNMISVLTRGRIWVNCETACAVGDPVYVRVLASGALSKGSVRNSTATNFILMAGMRFVTALAAAGLAQMEIR